MSLIVLRQLILLSSVLYKPRSCWENVTSRLSRQEVGPRYDSLSGYSAWRCQRCAVDGESLGFHNGHGTLQPFELILWCELGKLGHTQMWTGETWTHTDVNWGTWTHTDVNWGNLDTHRCELGKLGHTHTQMWTGETWTHKQMWTGETWTHTDVNWGNLDTHRCELGKLGHTHRCELGKLGHTHTHTHRDVLHLWLSRPRQS